MGRNRANRKRRGILREQIIDATPERLAKGDPFVFVDPAKIDSTEQPIGYVRQFRASHLDRLHRAGKLTEHQHQAGEWYRDTHHRAGMSLVVIASYGERITESSLSYGLPRTEAQMRARQMLRQAREQWSMAMRGFMERLLVHDDLPRYSRRRQMRTIAEIRTALDELSMWLRLQ